MKSDQDEPADEAGGLGPILAPIEEVVERFFVWVEDGFYPYPPGWVGIGSIDKERRDVIGWIRHVVDLSEAAESGSEVLAAAIKQPPFYTPVLAY